MGEKVNVRLHNAMIEVAVCEFWEKKIAEADWSKNGEHIFSVPHTKNIHTIIKKHKTGIRHRRLFRAAKRVAVVALILCAVTSVVLASSAAARDAVQRIRTNIIAQFMQENPNAPLGGDEFQSFQSGRQIEQLEAAVSNALETAGLPFNTSFQIHIDGWLNVSISGLSEEDAAKIKPYIEPMSSILSTAYAGENKNQIFYVQRIIRAYEEIKSDKEEDWTDTIGEYRQIIRDYIFDHDNIPTNEIMSKTRIITYVDGKLIFNEP